jgi:hypothetical protein
VELTRDELRLVAMPPRTAGAAAGAPAGAPGGERAGDAWYVYDCTGCARRVVVDVPPSVVVALVTVGVTVWRVPREVLERGTSPAAPLTMDDVLDAVLWIREARASDAVPAAPAVPLGEAAGAGGPSPLIDGGEGLDRAA